MSTSDDNEPFLSRWARRKRDAAREATPVEAKDAIAPTIAPLAGEAAAGDDAAPSPVAAAPEEEPLDLETLPKVDELTAESDITAFLDKRVPAMLRNAALSRIWTLDPTIRDFIEVAENQWNWNVPGGAPFYEEMLPGSGGGALFADATSAISRVLGDAGPEPSVAAVHSEIDKILPQNVDPSGSQLAAAHNTADAEHLRMGEAAGLQTAAVLPENSPLPPDVEPHETDVASQHQRRRHGGALPA